MQLFTLTALTTLLAAIVHAAPKSQVRQFEAQITFEGAAGAEFSMSVPTDASLFAICKISTPKSPLPPPNTPLLIPSTSQSLEYLPHYVPRWSDMLFHRHSRQPHCRCRRANCWCWTSSDSGVWLLPGFLSSTSLKWKMKKTGELESFEANNSGWRLTIVIRWIIIVTVLERHMFLSRHRCLNRD